MPALLLRLLSVVKLDEGHPQSWLMIADICEVLMVRGLRIPDVDIRAKRREAILRATALDPLDGRILIERGDLYFAAGETEAADAC